ncbi:hypothetical protein L7F22_067933 [Adiantum nelumboides]|nr:hypothetical protein [Adiantum nelumboides]
MAEASNFSVAYQFTPFHVTLFTKYELRKMAKNDIKDLMKEPLQHTIVDLGLRQRGEVYFRAIWWPQGRALRTERGLPDKDFHITISVSDNHCVDKSISALIQPRELTDKDLDIIARSLTEDSHFKMADFLASHYAAHLSASAFDMVFKHLLHAERIDSAWQLVTDCLIARKDFIPAYVRQGDLHARECRWKMAMLLYQSVCELIISNNILEKQKRIYAYCLKCLIKCAKHKELGALFDDEDVEWSSSKGKSTLDTKLLEHIGMPSERLRADLKEAVSIASLDDRRVQHSRHRLHFAQMDGSALIFYKMPRFFSWLVPYLLAVMSTPRNKEDIQALVNLRIGLVVTLTEEEALPTDWFSSKSIENLFLPVTNYKAPTIAQIETFIDSVLRLPSYKAALVHCGGGKGRAGTFAACHLLACGFSDKRTEYPAFSAAQAIEILRTLRPGSIETREQESFIATYLQYLYRNVGKEAVQPFLEPETALILDGSLDKNVSLIVCCGLPGSGKSHFAKLLQDGLDFAVISQDDVGGKEACFAEMGNAVKARKKIVVDRCNPTAQSRREFLTMAWRPKSALCVYFHYDTALCVQRADNRTNHPTIRQGRADRIVSSFDKTFVAQSGKEGFSCVAEATSFKAVAQLLEALGCKVNKRPIEKPKDIYKFPRTRHLLNFGSATRDDLILTESDVTAFLDTSDGSVITVEEKVDGANLGISIDSETLKFKVQNRSHYVNNKSHEQFKKIDKWLQDHSEQLFYVLDGYDSSKYFILYGEWLYAKHSIYYDNLPDTFLAFDLYDTQADKFYSRQKLETLLKEGAGQLHQVPQMSTPAQITKVWLASAIQQPSQFYGGHVEGVYLRKEKDDYLIDRAKIVRSDFISGDEHWTKGGVTQNQLRKNF